jgi:hypothetical protein
MTVAPDPDPREAQAAPTIAFRCPPHLSDHVPAPVMAKDLLPPWYRAMEPEVHFDLIDGKVPTAKRCPPFLDALLEGFYFRLSTDIDYDGKDFRWTPLPMGGSEPYPTAPIGFHAPVQLAGAPLGAPNHDIVKFNNFWTVELEPGWSILVTHPSHQTDLPFRTINAVIDADRYRDTVIQVPTLWLSAGVPCFLKRGTPIAQCFPIPRNVAYLGARAMSGGENAAFEANVRAIIDTPNAYRKNFRAHRKGSSA